MSNPTPAATERRPEPMLFQDLGSRKVVADFARGYLSSDGGDLLLRQVDRAFGVSRLLASRFQDRRDARLIDHRLEELLAPRLHALALGYQDLDDHDTLRRAPLLPVAAGKLGPLGADHKQARGHAPGAPGTLNRLELSDPKSSRYHKLAHEPIKGVSRLQTGDTAESDLLGGKDRSGKQEDRNGAGKAPVFLLSCFPDSLSGRCFLQNKSDSAPAAVSAIY